VNGNVKIVVENIEIFIFKSWGFQSRLCSKRKHTNFKWYPYIK